MIKLEVQLTADGSHTLYLPEMDEHYHSVNGAVQEALHVYLESAFSQISKREVSVLELGFGTGLNAFLTALCACEKGITVHYTTLEKFPLPDEITSRLNYTHTATQGGENLFRLIHSSPWGLFQEITPHFLLKKVQIDFSLYDYPDLYDVVYYDAFAPDKQAKVWSQELFDIIYSSMNEGGVLTTYCAKGLVRRMMLQSGFTVERIPGPPGKREMLRARKNPNPAIL